MSDIYIEIENLPIGWSLTSIENFADVLMGQSPPSDTYNEEGIGLPFFQGKAEFNEIYPTVRKWCKAPTKIAEPNDILMSVRAPVGATNIANVKCCIGRGLSAIRYTHCNKFLFYFFRLIEKKLDEKGTGTTFRAISGDVIKSAQIYLPPLPEQHRIVAKIEELFSSLDKAVESLKTAQQQLKTYRQAVLKWAFEGFDKNSTIGDEFDFIGGGTPSKEQPEYWNGSLCWCSVKDVKGDYLFNTIDKITEKGLIESSANLAQPDEVILITRITPGKTIITKIRTAINQDLKVVKPKKEYNPKLIHYLFQSIERDIINLSSGTTVLGISLYNLKSIAVPSISISEQHRIVSEIEKRLSVADKLEESIHTALQQAEALRQSILKKAFEGRLVPQDPNDEPASVLLERIKVERETLRQAQGKKNPAKPSKKSKQIHQS